MKNKNYAFQVHSFGYGDDHDEKVLDAIATDSNGKFYFIKTLSFIDECFIDCFGDLMSNFAKEIELEVHLANGVKFETVTKNSFQKKTDRVATIDLMGISTGKTLDYTAEISIDVKKNPFKLGKKVKIGKVDLNFVSGTEHFSFESDLALETVSTNTDKGEPDVDVEENYVKFEAIRIMEESKKKLEQGKEKECKWMMNDFLGRISKKKKIRKGFKKKMKNFMKYENVAQSKNYAQVNHMLRRDMVNPDFDSDMSSQKLNYRQKKMKKRKGI
jgi:hypothetical protein